MSSRLMTGLALLALAANAAGLRAQAEPISLAGRHHLTLSAGLSGTSRASTSVGVSGVVVESGASSLSGGVGYAYWLDNRLAVGVRALAVDVSADVSTTGVGTRATSGIVAAVLVGARYQLARLTASNALRPYVAVGVGPLLGSADAVTAGLPTTVTTVRQTAPSALVTLGADLSLGARVTLGVDAGYLVAADFDQPIGARTNYSDPVFTLSLGVLLGSGRAARVK